MSLLERIRAGESYAELAPLEEESHSATDTGTYVDYETPGGVRPGYDDVSHATDDPPEQPPRMPAPERAVSPTRAAIPPLAPLPPSAGGFAGAAPSGDAGGGHGGGSPIRAAAVRVGTTRVVADRAGSPTPRAGWSRWPASVSSRSLRSRSSVPTSSATIDRRRPPAPRPLRRPSPPAHPRRRRAARPPRLPAAPTCPRTPMPTRPSSGSLFPR